MFVINLNKTKYRLQVFLNLPDCNNSVTLHNIEFETKFSLLGLTPREISLILPLILTNSILNNNESAIKCEKVKNFFDLYRTALNYEFDINQRDSGFISRFKRVKIIVKKVEAKIYFFILLY
jgi:hypothetical protein